MGRLWTQPPDGHPFRPLQVMCEDWAAGFEERFARCAGGIDPGHAREAMTLFATYDALQHMPNCEQRLVADPVGFAQRMAGMLDLDTERLRLRLFARCLQE